MAGEIVLAFFIIIGILVIIPLTLIGVWLLVLKASDNKYSPLVKLQSDYPVGSRWGKFIGWMMLGGMALLFVILWILADMGIIGS